MVTTFLQVSVTCTKLSAPFALVFVHLCLCAACGHKKGRCGLYCYNRSGCPQVRRPSRGACPNKRPLLCSCRSGPFPGPLCDFMPRMCFNIPSADKIQIWPVSGLCFLAWFVFCCAGSVPRFLLFPRRGAADRERARPLIGSRPAASSVTRSPARRPMAAVNITLRNI